jgi:hypothetical protein
LHLLRIRKLALSSIILAVGALRLFFGQILHRPTEAIQKSLPRTNSNAEIMDLSLAYNWVTTSAWTEEHKASPPGPTQPMESSKCYDSVAVGNLTAGELLRCWLTLYGEKKSPAFQG